MLSWLTRHKQRIGTVVIGHTAKRIEEYLFDWLLYGVVVYTCTELWGFAYGSLVSFLIMAPLSALFCWTYLKLYDWAKVDWFGLEALKELHEVETKGWFGGIFKVIFRWGDIPIFILLSIYGDPFMVAVYFREKGHNHGGLSPRDWKIFWGSVLFSNAYWTLRWAFIFVVIEFLWEGFIKPLFS